jgi:hypothetical protein
MRNTVTTPRKSYLKQLWQFGVAWREGKGQRWARSDVVNDKTLKWRRRMTIDQSKFVELEYATLRKEIETSKANMFKLAVGGSAVIPAAQSVADSYSIGVITLALPLVVVVLVLLFLVENHSMMRAGTYILQEIEPKIDGVKGWETWLNSVQMGSGTRTVDKLLVFAFSVLAASYFIVSVVLAARFALREFGQQGQYVVGGIYVLLGAALSFALYSQAQTDTKAASSA